MNLIGAPTAWETGRGAGVTIAIVDSGLDLDHEDLAGKLEPGYNAVSPGQSPQDDNGHGTHVAGVAAAAVNNGAGIISVAPDARLMPVKAFEADGTGSESDIEEAIRWAVDHGARVINMSFGEDTIQPVLGPAFRDAVAYAWSKGAVPVVAAGNGGDGFLTSSGFSQENALVVSAVTKEDTQPGYSSRVGQAKWGIAAPGGADSKSPPEDHIFSTYGKSTAPGETNFYAYLFGTSMAAPHVSGAVAVLLSLGLSPTDAVNRLLSTAKDVGPAGKDTTFGHGRLDVAKAVEGLRPAGGTPGNGGTVPPGGTTTTRNRSRTTTTPAPSAGVAAPTTTTSVSVPAPGDPATTSTTAEMRVASPPLPSGSDDGRPWGASALAFVLLLAVSAGAARLRPSP